jgi:hypothetical protein
VEYLDLSPYEYDEFPLPMRSVGWLGLTHGLQGAGARALTPVDLERLESASWFLGSIMLGTHDCEFCPADSAFEGNGEYHYYAQSGEVYSAPKMILHYVREHGYRPPGVFLESLTEPGRLDWDWRAERLAEVLLDTSKDVEFRCTAILDLANWQDPQALDTLLRAAEDEELVDIAGDDIGRSLGVLLPCEFAVGVRAEDFPDMVSWGIGQGPWQ